MEENGKNLVINLKLKLAVIQTAGEILSTFYQQLQFCDYKMCAADGVITFAATVSVIVEMTIIIVYWVH